MLQWIANLIGKDFQDYQTTTVLKRDRHQLRVFVFRYEERNPGPFAERGHMIELYEQLPGGRFGRLAVFSETDLQPAIVLLKEARDVVGQVSGALRLPTVSMCGSQYFIDTRLRELRDVDDPHHRVPFDEE